MSGLTFRRIAPDESRVYLDGDHVGDVYRQQDVLSPGSHFYMVHLDEDPAAVIARLDKARAKYADIVLVHGGGPGVERIAAKWAERNGVHQVVCKPDWDRHGRAAPFRRNDELLNLLPKGVIAFPGSGITENLVDKARQLGIPVVRCAA